jgi:hypothetical protein
MARSDSRNDARKGRSPRATERQRCDAALPASSVLTRVSCFVPGAKHPHPAASRLFARGSLTPAACAQATPEQTKCTGVRKVPQGSQLVGRSAHLGVSSRCVDRSQRRRRQSRRLRPLLGVKDDRARSRRLLPEPGRRADAGARPLAGLAGRARALGYRGKQRRGPGLHRADGGPPSSHRQVAAARGRQRSARRWDRSDLQRAEVRLGAVGARR